MGWTRQQFKKEVRERPRHARVSLCIVRCVDCQRELHATHLVHRFGERCRPCFDAFQHGPTEMASHWGQGTNG